MIQKKICMVGAFATGKTSLIARYVKGIYSEKYQTTIGVKIDKKVIKIRDQSLTLILWDIHGEDEFQNIRMSYLRGAAGYFLVIDGTRHESLDVALKLHAKVVESIGNVPFVTVINKSDLRSDWEISDEEILCLKAQGYTCVRTSAKLDTGVDQAFQTLVQKLLDRENIYG